MYDMMIGRTSNIVITALFIQLSIFPFVYTLLKFFSLAGMFTATLFTKHEELYQSADNDGSTLLSRSTTTSKNFVKSKVINNGNDNNIMQLQIKGFEISLSKLFISFKSNISHFGSVNRNEYAIGWLKDTSVQHQQSA
ncbi:hypothetical protein EDC96DRAFT_565827 [Choanephora cucurbitarum]|nr:hypothetical protein EDC96DRAFT_565827 [Choanephora cucurbitarum]